MLITMWRSTDITIRYPVRYWAYSWKHGSRVSWSDCSIRGRKWRHIPAIVTMATIHYRTGRLELDLHHLDGLNPFFLTEAIIRVLFLILLFVAWFCVATDNCSFRHLDADDDLLYYQIGGGEAVMLPPASHSPSPLSVGIDWNSVMMCGIFDIDTTMRNQLNGITDGFQQLMGTLSRVPQMLPPACPR